MAKRNFPWKCEILDVRSEGQKIADLKKTEDAKKKAEAAAKKKAEAAAKKKAEAAAKEKAKAAALDKAKQELIPVLKAEIHEMLKSKCNEQTEFSIHEFRDQMKSLFRRVRDTFFLTNLEMQSITKIPKKKRTSDVPVLVFCGLSILDWCGLEYTTLTRTDDDGEGTVFVKIKNLQNNEEE